MHTGATTRQHRRGANINRPCRGVSVLEVLMSIGIVSVGLLGVVALVPVGGHQANRGFLADFKSLYGKSAYRQFELRGMGEPDNWGIYRITSSPGAITYQDIQNRPPAARPHGYCLDPRFVAIEDPTSNIGAARFPYLRPNGSGNDYFNPPNDYYNSSSTDPLPLHRITLNVQGNAMPKAMADLIFQSNDDLTIGKPKDRSLPPIPWDDIGEAGPKPWQAIDDTPGLSDPNLIKKRMAEGDLSWMATIVPKVTAAGTDDLYILSLVVFEKRLLVPFSEIGTTSTATIKTDEHGLPERVVQINASDMLGGGYGGGEVRLRLDSGNPIDLQNEDNDFGAGNWIMLMRNSQQGSIYRWYKVIAADDEIDDTMSPVTRTVTLDGPDWLVDSTGTYTTYAVIMPSAVAVYEKTVRLEGSSLFEF